MVTMKRGQISDINKDKNKGPLTGSIKDGSVFIVFTPEMCRPGDFESFEANALVLYVSNARSGDHEKAVVVIPEDGLEILSVAWDKGVFKRWSEINPNKGTLIRDSDQLTLPFDADKIKPQSDKIKFKNKVPLEFFYSSKDVIETVRAVR